MVQDDGFFVVWVGGDYVDGYVYQFFDVFDVSVGVGWQSVQCFGVDGGFGLVGYFFVDWFVGSGFFSVDWEDVYGFVVEFVVGVQFQ